MTDSWDDGDDDESEELDHGYGFADGLDAFDDYHHAVPPAPVSDGFDAPSADDDDFIETLFCKAANPAGTVTATALLSGSIYRIDLSPGAARMTEHELAEEITMVATLANQQARAAQHVVISTLMHRLGNDPAATRALLERQLGLPTPDAVVAQRAEMFAGHYHDPEH